MLVRQHPFRRLLGDQEAAEGANGDRLRHFRRHQIDERAARASGGVINHHVGAADLALDQAEQPLDLIGVGGIAGKGVSAGLAAQRAELCGLASRASDALRPSPAPTIRAVLYFGISMGASLALSLDDRWRSIIKHRRRHETTELALD
jgi:hypothetical protein